MSRRETRRERLQRRAEERRRYAAHIYAFIARWLARGGILHESVWTSSTTTWSTTKRAPPTEARKAAWAKRARKLKVAAKRRARTARRGF